ncbi:MAG: DegV family EDD domain-containing protein [Legionellaceae bacterium]|nr:DegV family EDD domain-containing protein [Legionellaceae bacterium]
MELTILDKGRFYQALCYACQHLAEQRERINAINVFPVADGDTGDNMSATARAILLHAREMDSLAATAQSVADASVIGARGNSGMIFSQFFNGIAEGITKQRTLDTLAFAHIIALACQKVRQAIFHPVEGTILTVMEQWARCLQDSAPHTGCFNRLMQHGLTTLEAALAATETTLAVLKNARVVDAGALGFYHFISGFAAFLANPKLTVDAPEHTMAECAAHEAPAADRPPQHRYCTEAVVIHPQLDKDKLATLLAQHGDSIVLSANPRLCRFHVHSNEPRSLFGELQTLGRIQYPKVDDMLRQYESVHQRKSPIALVTDSSANLAEGFINAHQIHMIPVNVHVDGHDLLDCFCLDSNQLYQRLNQYQHYPTTSFPSPALIRDKLRFLSEHYAQVLVISLARVLSGTHDALLTVAQSLGNVHVIDSRQVAGGQGLLVDKAAHLIAEGYAVTQICQILEQQRQYIKMYVMVEQFDSMIRSGRVSKLKGKLAQFSGMKPIISLDEQGKGFIFDKAFSQTRAFGKMVESVQKQHQHHPLQEYAIVHAAAEDRAREFAAFTTEAFGKAPLFIEPVSTAIGLHAGQGCVALTARFTPPAHEQAPPAPAIEPGLMANA